MTYFPPQGGLGVIQTYTPTLVDFSFNESESQTYNIQTGFYQLVGNRLFLSGDLDMSSIGTLTTGARISTPMFGLGVRAATSPNTQTMHMDIAGSAIGAAGENVSGHMFQFETWLGIVVYSATGGWTGMTCLEVGNAGHMTWNGSIIVEPTP